MKDRFESNQPRMTDAERRYVWEQIREGRSRRSVGITWLKWSPAFAGALAVLILAFVLVDKTPSWKPVMRADREAQAPAMSAKERDRSVDLVISSDSANGEGALRDDDALANPSKGFDQTTQRSEGVSPLPSAVEPLDPQERLAFREPATYGGIHDLAQESALEANRQAVVDAPATNLAAPKPEENDEAVASSAPPAGTAGSSANTALRDGVAKSEAPPSPTERTMLKSMPHVGSTQGREGAADLQAATPADAPRSTSERADQSGAKTSNDDGSSERVRLQGSSEWSASKRTETDTRFPQLSMEQNLKLMLDGLGDKVSPPPNLRAQARPEGSASPEDAASDAMFFQDYGANPLMLADRDRLSTFAVDVDGGAYTLARNYIEHGALPDRAAPRVEEFVNYFSGGYPTFDNEDFRIFVDGAPSPFGAGFQLMRVGIKARTIAESERRPSRLTFVIDVSGSMEREDRLGLVQRALRVLVDQLEERDRVGIVIYGTRGEVLLEPVSVAQRGRILEAIEALTPDGSTNAEEGLLLGYEMAQRSFDPDANNRIVLCSDGVANVGRTGPEEILKQVRAEADRGIYLTTVGFGMGNYNDVLMEQLANGGDGAYYYVDDLDEARRVFVERLTGTLEIVARDAKVQVEFDPERVMAYRLLGFENRDVADQDFRNDQVDAGEIGSGHEVTALYEVRFRDGVQVDRERGEFATVRFRYELPPEGDRRASTIPFGAAGRDDYFSRRGTPVDQDRIVREIARAVGFDDLEHSFEDAPVRFRLAAAVAEFAETLRQSYWAKESRIADLLPLARHVASELRGDREVADFARLVEMAASIEERLSPDQVAQRDRIRETQKPVPPYFP